jgi:hypothetical protein
MQMMPDLVKKDLCNLRVTKESKMHQKGRGASGNDVVRDELYPCRFTLPFVMVEATARLTIVLPTGNSMSFPATTTG